MSFCLGIVRKCRTIISHPILKNRLFSSSVKLRTSERSSSVKLRTSERIVGFNFIPLENIYAHEVLEKSTNYSLSRNIIFDNEKAQGFNKEIDWMSIPIQDLCVYVEKISHNAHITKENMSDLSYSPMCQAIKLRCKELNDEQLSNMIQNLSLWPFFETVKETNFYTYWKSLDDLCFARWKNWDTKKLLYYVDLWYKSRLPRQSDFVFYVISRLATKPKRLTPHEVVQVLFYLNILRTALVNVSIYDLEIQFKQSLDELTLDEIGVGLMGFFKTQHILHDQNAVRTIIERLKKEADTVSDITLATVLKTLRFSMNVETYNEIVPTLDVLEKQIERLSLVACIHMALMVTKSITFHRASLSKIAQKLVNNISNARLKDIEKIIYPLTLLSFDPHTYPCVYKSVIKELEKPEREKEYELYPKTLVAILYYLSLRGILIKPLISRVLDQNFIETVYGKNKYTIRREILFIDTSVGLHCPDYTGPRLKNEISNYLAKRFSQYMPDDKNKKSKHAEHFFDIKSTLETLFGQNFTCKYLLPNHARADFVFRLDENNNALPIPESYEEIKEYTGIIPAPKEGKWFALIVGSRNMFARGTGIPNGETNCKLKQLKILGYTPVLVQHTEWPGGNTMHKIEHLKKLIFTLN